MSDYKVDVMEMENVIEQEFAEQYLHGNRPLLIKNYAANWRATRLWNPQYIADLAPDLSVPVKQLSGLETGDIPIRRMTLSDYVEYIKQIHPKIQAKFSIAMTSPS